MLQAGLEGHAPSWPSSKVDFRTRPQRVPPTLFGCGGRPLWV